MPPENRDENVERSPQYTLVEEDVTTDLDPELQEIVICRGQNPSVESSLTLTEDDALMVDVIAKLRQPEQEVDGLIIAQRMGQIVTGTVRADQIEHVRSQVISLKAARKLRATLGRSVREIEAAAEQLQQQLPASLGGVNGSGVVVGIIDGGCDFAHPNFLLGGRTRIKFLWDQQGDAATSPPPGFFYGREFNRQALDNALASDTRAEAYKRLRYDPGFGSHGTYVMDIAAGSGSATNPPGVAPGADIIFVDLSMERLEDHESLGNSRHLLDAIKYVFARAGAQPAVVNVSLNVNGGPHDGSSLVEQGIDQLLSKRKGRAVVIAAGNSRSDRHHVSRQLQAGQSSSLLVEMPEMDTTDNKIDIWYSGEEELEVFLFSPRGVRLGPFPLGKTITINQQDGPAARVYHRKADPNNGDNQIVIRYLVRVAEVGTWRIALRQLGTRPVVIHAWIESDPGANSTFREVLPTDTACTLGSLACGRFTIAVSAYDPDAPNQLPVLTAEGPTRNGRQKPEVSAPGFAIRAADSRINFTIREDGTSAASPHVAGLIALLMQAAGPLLSVEQIRDAVINHARNSPPPPGTGWDSRYGMGRISAVAAILAQVNPAPLFINAATSSTGAVSNAVNSSPLLSLSHSNRIEGSRAQGEETNIVPPEHL